MAHEKGGGSGGPPRKGESPKGFGKDGQKGAQKGSDGWQTKGGVFPGWQPKGGWPQGGGWQPKGGKGSKGKGNYGKGGKGGFQGILYNIDGENWEGSSSGWEASANANYFSIWSLFEDNDGSDETDRKQLESRVIGDRIV